MVVVLVGILSFYGLLFFSAVSNCSIWLANRLVMKPFFTGLPCLLTEFLRAQPSSCKQDESEPPISLDPTKFTYNTTCSLTCSVEKGPFSPLREGSGNNIYVIPAPDKLSFGTATFFAAAGCVQVVLSLIVMWGRQLEFNWVQLYGSTEGSKVDGEIAKTRKYWCTKELHRMYIGIKAISVPLFIAELLAFIVIGERNLFSSQLRYQTDPIASIGK